jgi:hypothetical protein
MSVIAAEAVGLIGKPSAAEDFQILRSALGTEPEVERLARSCLRLHIETESAMSSFLFRYRDDWWICRAENEAGSDASGRPRSRIFFTMAQRSADPSSMLAALNRAGRNSTFDLNTELDLPVAEDVKPEASEAGRRAAIALLLGSRVVVVQRPSEAAWVAAAFSGEEPRAFMVSNGRVAWQTEFNSLLAIGQSNWFPPLLVDRIAQLIGTREIPAIPALWHVPLPESRTKLLQIWLGELPLHDPSALTAEEKTWLLAAGVRRPEIIAGADGDLKRRWLSEGRLTSAEILEHKASWGPSEHRTLAGLLANDPQGLKIFIQCAGPGAADIPLLLSPPLASAYAWLKASGAERKPPDLDLHLMELDAFGVLEGFDLSSLSGALRQHDSPPVRKAWREKLVSSGLAKPIAAWLADGSSLASAPLSAPGLQPDESWLRVVPAERLLAGGAWAGKESAWRHWWAAALQKHPDTAEMFSPRIDARFSFAALDWLVGEIEDHRLESQEALTTLGSWQKQEIRPGPTEIARLLDSCEFPQPNDWTALISGGAGLENIPCSIDNKRHLEKLIAVGLVALEQVARSVAEGRDIEWLDGLISPASRSLIHLTQSPPAAVPERWDACLNPVLSLLVSSPDFWARWSGNGVSLELVEWMDTQIERLPGGALVRELASALKSQGDRLQPATLKCVAQALPRVARLEQAVLWADPSHPEHERAFLALCAGQEHAGLQWLHGQIGSWNAPLAVPGDLPSRELKALLPWLHPVRDVVRVVMSRRKKDDGEDSLLEALLRELRASRHQPPAPPPPELAALRRNWVVELGKLPGWEQWSKIFPAGPKTKSPEEQ